jgi:Domain of unknown function (DUF4349)
MSQPDLLRELRDARPTAPEELRERVRLIAAQAPPPNRRVTWKRAALVLVPAVAAVAAAVVAIPRGGENKTAVTTVPAALDRLGAPTTARQRAFGGLAHGAGVGGAKALPVPAPSARPQRYSASLDLRVANANSVSVATTRAQRIIASLSGYPVRMHVDTEGKLGTADLVFKVPRTNVQQAVARLSALGTVVGEYVNIQDLGAQVNATDRLIARLQKQLADLRAQTQTDDVKRKIDAITRQIEGLQRAEANTVRQAHYATVELQLSTHKPAKAHPKHHGHGPLHGLGVAFRWIGIGLVYALALGGPLLAVLGLAWLAARIVRRRREDALLSRP